MITIGSFEDVIEPVDYSEFQPGQTMGNLFKRFLKENQIEEYLDFEPRIEQIVIVYRHNMKKRVDLDEKVENVLAQNDGQVEIVAVYPEQSDGALIQFLVKGQITYFDNFVNKSDTLSIYLQKVLKEEPIKEDISIEVNGKEDDESEPFEKKTIKNLMDKFDKVMVEVNAKKKSSGPIIKTVQPQKPQSVVNIVKKEKSEKAVKPQKKIKKPEVKPEIQQNGIKIEESKPKKEEEKLQITFSFDTSNENRCLSFYINPQQTMLDLFPNILQKMIDSGFNWDIDWKEYSDKLVIFHERSQLKSFGKKIQQLFAEADRKKLNFVIRRLYEGG